MELSEEIRLEGGPNAIAGAIRDLRKNVTEGLRRKANIECGRFDVILSRGQGYRFADCLSVQEGDKPDARSITDMDGGSDVRDVPDDVRNDGAGVRNEGERDVRNDVRNNDGSDVRDVPDDEASLRRAWILQQLTNGEKLKAPAVANNFGRSVKTAERDLTALKDQGCIEYVGSSRNGYYLLRQMPQPDQ